MKPVDRILSWSPRFVPGLAAAALAGACGTEPPLPASIAVSPPSATLPWLGDTVQLTAAVRDTAGRTMRGVTVVWTSEDESVATVDASGLVTAVAKGVTLVRAKAGWVEDLATVTVAPDRRALLSFYEALNGSRWPLSENWGTDAPLDEWYGVTADSKDNVLALEMGFNRLSGTIPPEIGALGALEELNLINNFLRGSIPPELGNLRSLRVLILFGNRLEGPVPPELGSLENLRYLVVSNAVVGLTGPIPPELGSLRNLRRLDLSSNDLAGAIPPELESLENLRYPEPVFQRTHRRGSARTREPREPEIPEPVFQRTHRPGPARTRGSAGSLGAEPLWQQTHRPGPARTRESTESPGPEPVFQQIPRLGPVRTRGSAESPGPESERQLPYRFGPARTRGSAESPGAVSGRQPAGRFGPARTREPRQPDIAWACLPTNSPARSRPNSDTLGG